MKQCSICHEEKSFDSFYKDARGANGLYACCKRCHTKRYYGYGGHDSLSIERKRRVLKTVRVWQARNRDKVLATVRRWQEKNKDKVNANIRRWQSKNKGKVLLSVKKWRNKAYKTDIKFRILCVLRTRMSIAMKNKKKSNRTMDLVGTSMNGLRNHLESQFKDGMSWENYGKFGWHIDHIRPCASFDLSDPEQQKQCFHYTNLQPLWAHENLTKHAKYTP